MEKIIEFIKNSGILSLKGLITISIFLAIVAFFLVFRGVLSYLVIKLFNLKIKDRKVIKSNAFYKPLKLYFFVLGIFLALLFLQLPANIMLGVNKAFRICIIAIIATGIAESIGPDSGFFKRLKANQNTDKNKTLINFCSKILKAIIYVFAGVIIISELGYDINGLIAGLGLGSVVFALAAQDTAKNLFGGIVIITDKPFVVGDWVEISTIEGVVEDISFRSTRIRTFDNSLVALPNSILANENITNWSKMKKRKISFSLNLDYNTPPKNISNAINDIQIMLHEHKNVLSDSIYVHLNEIKDSGLNVLIYFFSSAIPYEDYLTTRENINMKILQILKSNNTPLVYKTQSVKINNN
ncbi:MAG: mechanosensitive ion channel family protein [Clostridia bacterium]